jgi:hypothetical protein
MDLARVFETVASIGIGAGLLVWLLRSLVSQLLSRDLERYKVELNATHDAQIARLRADLNAAAFEHETRFARLHEERARVVAGLYQRLAKTNAMFSQFMQPLQIGGEQQHKKLHQEAAQCANDFIDFFNENRIYLHEDVTNAIDDLISELRRAWAEFTAHSGRPYPDPREWMSAWKKVTDDIPPLRRRIESEFRQLLGVPETASNTECGRPTDPKETPTG